jgi:hypothetical protein
MPADYGTWDYYVSLDREAPPRNSLKITRPNKPFAVYPFGYYALVAAWVSVLHLVHDGPVFVFFGCRILSVLMLIGTLFTIDATARRLHFSTCTALLITACIGFFPLTTFVASAVQGDNLSFLLVSLAFYLAVRVREKPYRLGSIVYLGLVLGALLVTKVHFFACLSLPIFLMVLTELIWKQLPTKQVIGSALLLTLPAVLTGTIYLWTTWGTTNYYYPPSTHANTIGHSLQMVWTALADYYSGTTHESFWGVFGWLDTPLVIKSKRINDIFRFVIQGMAFALLALTLVRVEQVSSRLLRVARAGRRSLAWRMMVSDVLINSYFLFTLFMICLYVRIDNRFGAQGRNWLPLLLPIILVAAKYAPKGLSYRGSRTFLTKGVFTGMLVYSLLGSLYAVPTLQKRYYEPPHPHHDRGERVVPVAAG